MDYLSLIKQPIQNDLNHFIDLFNESLTHSDGLLGSVLSHIRQRGGKRMRPILIFLSSKNYCNEVNDMAQYAAVGLELLHTASLVHDDVVDESSERRGQASVNAEYNNKVAVLVGDYILSSALLRVSMTNNQRIIQLLADLGRTLAAGEILQLSNIQNTELSEDVYFEVINQKTAVLFEACAKIGAIAANAPEEEIAAAAKFGQNIGLIFQIRDDIFDYFNSPEIGKPTGNDMLEGKLTLPVLYALNHTSMESVLPLARKVKSGTVNKEEIDVLIEFTKQSGGIEYAERKMDELAAEARQYIEKSVRSEELRRSFNAYLDYVIERNY